ncbi:carbohydrate-binding module family 1 protein [Phlebiopsis gigantea 11061_1 CR5-6]|uniref:Carbohydrate-binding module family 1 protein n=1 Tax=Phlebiopsis gigantea (strain 11061_1 CR5-6) TaxID=745531 RepID=A0A0C3SDN5_PHLG1|nr:carbohydrate-binding module family 1 protein [Phlebiopsis gigantea 11061_1 CR5-6]
MRWLTLLSTLLASAVPFVHAVSSQAYTWKNVKIGGGGGFIPGIIFNPSQKGLAYARTDIGGAYKLNSDDTWTPLLDFADNARWNYWGVDALATDPVDPTRLYLATGMYTNSWDPNNGQILISTDQGQTFTPSVLPFKVGGNMPGRGMGERLAVDPNSNNILFFGARSGNGLWKSTDHGTTWAKVSSLPDVGTYEADPTDTTGYNNDKQGVAFVTFDSTSGSSGTATPRIFVGVGTNTGSNLFMSNDAGSTWSALPGTNSSWMPHKGVLSPAEHSLYISTSDGSGPYDGTLGALYKYNITSGTMANITPVSGGDLYFGFGGLAVDLQKPGTVMVAALNCWWPDGNAFRSTDGGQTWTRLWDWASYPTMNRFYTYDDSLAPWLGPDVTASGIVTQIGWMMEALAIDPFDSNHWLYGTGATIYGGHDLLKWDTTRNVTIKSLADGIEETAVQALLSPPTGPSLLSGLLDEEGFVHSNLNVAPSSEFATSTSTGITGLDYAGNSPATIVRVGNGDASDGKQIAISPDSGTTWNLDYGSPDGVSGGKVAISADGDIVLWSSSSNGVQVSQYTNAFTTVSTLPAGAAIASDKKVDSIFYAGSGSSFYLSTDGGKTFTATSKLGSSSSVSKVIVNPSVTGDVWVSTDTGLFHSTNNGTTFTAISGVTQAWSISLGAPATTGGYPAVFAIANIGSVGYFRSDDQGSTWVQINDAAHGFGSAGANVISGDPRIYGRVYVGTNGRGIFYGDTAGTTVTSSASASSSSHTTSSSSSSSSSSKTTSSMSTSSSHTTSTVSSTSSSPSTSSTGAAQGAYGQCGGNGWTGATTCVSGYSCVVQNAYYSQCVPS